MLVFHGFGGIRARQNPFSVLGLASGAAITIFQGLGQSGVGENAWVLSAAAAVVSVTAAFTPTKNT